MSKQTVVDIEVKVCVSKSVIL